ncbi:FUSC family protein [Streptomyces sp. NPDC048409]|uniref:FUSC family protein n=1 Tax=Streptomyces sp. NPDC048409 TaxID=3154723 RepID=UPI0034487895
MGAAQASIGDTAPAYRMRLYRLAASQLVGAAGVMMGTLVYGTGWWAVLVLTLTALVSGIMSSIGPVASLSGMLLLLDTVLGAGLPLGQLGWAAPLLLPLGGLFLLCLSVSAWPWRRRSAERTSVAEAYRAVADQLDATGTPHYEATRRTATNAVMRSYDLLLARRFRPPAPHGSLDCLIAQLNALVALAEAAIAARHSPSVPANLGRQTRALADSIAHSSPPTKNTNPPEPPRNPLDHALYEALRHATAVVAEEADIPHDNRLSQPLALGTRTRRAARNVLLCATSRRYGLRLALCIGLGQIFVSAVAVPRSYWIALTITLVLKPDYGSVFSRAVLRAIGTVLGLLITGVVLAAAPNGWPDTITVVALAGLIPVMTARGYLYQTAAITPVILLLSDTLNHEGFGLVGPRLIDSLIGCAIVLVAGYACWPDSWHTDVGDRLAAVIDEAAAYVQSSFGGAPALQPGMQRQTRARHRLYSDLSAVRSEVQRATTEPPPVRAHATAWLPLLVAVERIADAITAARVQITHGAPPPLANEADLIALKLRDLAEAVRATAVPPTRCTVKDTDKGRTLDPLRQEICAARAVWMPQFY